MKKWVECTKSGVINDLWVKTNEESNLQEYIIIRAYTVPANHSPTQENCFEAPLSFPLGRICNKMSCWFVVQSSNKDPAQEGTVQKKNAFLVLMKKDLQILLTKDPKNNKCKLRNDIILISKLEVPKELVSKYEGLVDVVTDALWRLMEIARSLLL